MSEGARAGVFVLVITLVIFVTALWLSSYDGEEYKKAQPPAGFTCRHGFIVPEGSHFDVAYAGGIACATSAAAQITCWEVERCR